MNKLFLGVATLFFSNPSFASYLEACDFTATVVETASAPDLGGSVNFYAPLVKVRIDSAINRGSHVPTACDSRIGSEQWLVSKLETITSIGQVLKIDYFYVNSFGPDGVVMSERWTVTDSIIND